MITWMFYVVRPFLPSLAPATEYRLVYASMTVAGILMRLIAFALLSRATITGEWTLNRAVAMITLFGLPALARVTGTRVLHERFKAATLGALLILWPTLFTPTPSRYALAVSATFTIVVALLLYAALERTPRSCGLGGSHYPKRRKDFR
jgi:hypothetical protein